MDAIPKAQLTYGDIIGHLVMWLVIILLTFGIGLLFYPYSFAKFVLNRSSIVVDGSSYRYRCKVDPFDQIGHLILWAIAIVLTFGLAYPFYWYRVWHLAFNNCTTERDA